MNKYLIESDHSNEDCLHILDLVQAQGYLTHYEWGCNDGVHIGWAILEADSKEEALLSVPPLIRNKARVIKLNKFSDKDLQNIHKEIES